MSQVATQFFNVDFAGETEITVFTDSRIVFSIYSRVITPVCEFVTTDGNNTVLITYKSQLGKNLQANLMFDRGMKIRTYSGDADSVMSFIITTSAPGA